MQTASVALSRRATQSLEPTRKDRLARLATEVGDCVGRLRTLMVMTAPHGLPSTLAAAMAWRVERRSREVGGSEKLSVAGWRAEVQLHLIEGRRDIAADLIGALLEGLPFTPEVPLMEGALLRVVERNGQRYLRSDQ